jgi:hypothetical protein
MRLPCIFIGNGSISFYIIADISDNTNLGVIFLGVKTNSDEVYFISMEDNCVLEGYFYLNKNMYSYLYFKTKIWLFYKKYLKNANISRSIIREDYDMLFKELHDEDPSAINSYLLEKIEQGQDIHNFQISPYWADNYWVVGYWAKIYYHIKIEFEDWFIYDTDPETYPNARQLTDEEIDEIMNSDDFPF